MSFIKTEVILRYFQRYLHKLDRFVHKRGRASALGHSPLTHMLPCRADMLAERCNGLCISGVHQPRRLHWRYTL